MAAQQRRWSTCVGDRGLHQKAAWIQSARFRPFWLGCQYRRFDFMGRSCLQSARHGLGALKATSPRPMGLGPMLSPTGRRLPKPEPTKEKRRKHRKPSKVGPARADILAEPRFGLAARPGRPTTLPRPPTSLRLFAIGPPSACARKLECGARLRAQGGHRGERQGRGACWSGQARPRQAKQVQV